MTPELLQAATGCGALRSARFAGPLTVAMKRWGIDTPLRQAGFLGQIAHESGNFSRLEESLTYSPKRLTEVWPSRFPTLAAAAPYASNPAALAEKVYSGRMDNNTLGEAYFYRGRGLKQLTGQANYLAYSFEADNEALTKPDILLQPEYAADSAGWFWSKNRCNSFADKRDWRGLTKRINGGLVGLDDRVRRIEKALRALEA